MAVLFRTVVDWNKFPDAVAGKEVREKLTELMLDVSHGRIRGSSEATVLDIYTRILFANKILAATRADMKSINRIVNMKRHYVK